MKKTLLILLVLFQQFFANAQDKKAIHKDHHAVKDISAVLKDDKYFKSIAIQNIDAFKLNCSTETETEDILKLRQNANKLYEMANNSKDKAVLYQLSDYVGTLNASTLSLDKNESKLQALAPYINSDIELKLESINSNEANKLTFISKKNLTINAFVDGKKPSDGLYRVYCYNFPGRPLELIIKDKSITPLSSNNFENPYCIKDVFLPARIVVWLVNTTTKEIYFPDWKDQNKVIPSNCEKIIDVNFTKSELKYE